MSRTEKILIVDDEVEIRNLLSELIGMKFSGVDFAEDGEDACNKIKEKKYDLVLTDIAMPGADGLEVLKYAKKLFSDIVVLIMTGQATLKTAIDAVNLGADQYITKPFDITYLLSTIDTHLDRQRLARENIRLQLQTERDHDKLRKNLVELTTLFNFTSNLAFNFNVSAVYDSILESLSEAVSSDFCSLFDIKRKTISIKTAVTLNNEFLEWLRTHLSTVARTEYTGAIEEKDIAFDIREAENVVSKNEKVEAFFDIVLKVEKETFGVLNVSRCAAESFSEDDKRFIIKLADQGSTVFTQLHNVVKSQKSKMQQLIEDLPDGVIMHDKHDDSILINPATENMFADTEISQFDKNNIEKIFNIRFQDIYDNKDQEDKTFIQEIKIPRQDKKSIVIDAHIVCLCDQDGLSQGILMTLRDVTQERQVERLKSEFISNVSHELRTPAAILKEFISILHDGIAGPTTSSQDDYLQIMTNNIDRLLRLIDNLLNMSLMEAGILKLRNVKINIKSLLESVIRTLHVLYEKKQMTVRLEIQEDIQEIYADPDALTQILINCLDNSRKFSSEGNEVILRAKVENSTLFLDIQDSGQGIPKHDIQRIFDRFYRIEDKEKARQEGSGLGLAIIKEFVDLYGGTISVDSELEVGTTFHITIPLQTVDEVAEVNR